MPKLLVFYMSKEDEDEFLDYVRSLGNLLILAATSPSSDFTPMYRLPEPSQDESTRRFWLQNTGVGLPLVAEQVPEKDYYVVDGFQSPVIEFWRSWTVSQIMLPGGMQADMNYIERSTGVWESMSSPARGLKSSGNKAESYRAVRDHPVASSATLIF